MFKHLLSTYGHNGVAVCASPLREKKDPRMGGTRVLFLLRARIGTEPSDRKEVSLLCPMVI